jgi:hypothetical protein
MGFRVAQPVDQQLVETLAAVSRFHLLVATVESLKFSAPPVERRWRRVVVICPARSLSSPKLTNAKAARMALPQSSHPIWSDLVCGRKTLALEFLAANLLIARLRLVIHDAPGPATEARCAQELYQLYADNAGLPSARRDIAKLG